MRKIFVFLAVCLIVSLGFLVREQYSFLAEGERLRDEIRLLEVGEAYEVARKSVDLTERYVSSARYQKLKNDISLLHERKKVIGYNSNSYEKIIRQLLEQDYPRWAREELHQLKMTDTDDNMKCFLGELEDYSIVKRVHKVLFDLTELEIDIGGADTIDQLKECSVRLTKLKKGLKQVASAI